MMINGRGVGSETGERKSRTLSAVSRRITLSLYNNITLDLFLKVPGGPASGPNANPEKQGTDMKLLGIVVGSLVGIIVLCVVRGLKTGHQ